MRYVFKQLTRQLGKNAVYLFFMVLISGFTSFMYFFVHFSVDGNLEILKLKPVLTEAETVYQNALFSNRILAGNGLAVFCLLGSLVFVMFFYRFFRSEGKQIGCLKAMGVSDGVLKGYFIAAAALLSGTGGILGLAGGYIFSDILIRAGEKSYLVFGLVKSIDWRTFVVGFFLPMTVFSFSTFLTCRLFAGKEAGMLISGASMKGRQPRALKAADKAASRFPEHHRLSVRLALRKPVALCFLIISVGTVLVMFILGYSLTLSSGKVFRSQTEGRHYQFDTLFDGILTEGGQKDGTERYLTAEGLLVSGHGTISQVIVGADLSSGLFELIGTDGERMPPPVNNSAIISGRLEELYGVREGDSLVIEIGGRRAEVIVSGTAFNGAVHAIYLSKAYMEELLSLPEGAYNGVWSEEPLAGMADMDGVAGGGKTMTWAEYIDMLERGAVSNKSSAVINHVIGCVVGILFLYLALLINFQDSARDILILKQMGYEAWEIRKMMIDIYRPVICAAFVILTWPGILLVKYILRSLAIRIGDYMPFQTNGAVVLGIFVVLNIVYGLVQFSFEGAVRKAGE